MARKRAREELPSDDELQSSSAGGNGGHGTTTDSTGKRMRENSGKKKRVRRREGRDGRERGVMEEEIVVPRITQHSTIPPLLISFIHAALFMFFFVNPRFSIPQTSLHLTPFLHPCPSVFPFS